MASKLVIVESPAKAKTINKYLGDDYTVIASFGHIRDLLPKDGAVRPDEDFAMDWAVSDRAGKAISDITNKTKQAKDIYLATDPDREGEAIAWHIREVLNSKNALAGKQLHRVTFNEITRQTVQEAIAHPRTLDQPLIDAYMARRALDFLVGFCLSPVLWRKLPGSKSAGRVQSVALRLICERESEIEKFKPQEFWSIAAIFRTADGQTFPARLTHLNGKKLDKFSFKNQAEAEAAVAAVETLAYQVTEIEKRQLRRNPAPPFTTSTLQQAASHQLGFGATRTMRLAQQLYEGVDVDGDTVGLITYMRTDGVSLSQEAITAARKVIGNAYGQQYLPSEPRLYKSSAKNAQEAHEAIRPTDLARRPEMVASALDADQYKLYSLIWQRTMASQMASAVLDQVSADIAGDTSKAMFRAVGTTTVFDGYQRVWQEAEDDDKTADGDEDDGRTKLPALTQQQKLARDKTLSDQHFTQPPPRYSEASLVKKLEELGIGRPSTYASIMQVLQDRTYVTLDKKRFVPEDRGRIVTAFLENFFGHYVEYDFTADLENKLDDISSGAINWKQVLREFWQGFSSAIDGTKDLKISDVIDALDEALGPHFFPLHEDGTDPRKCGACADGRMGLKLGKFGAFIGCSNYPACRNTRPLAISEAGDGQSAQLSGPRDLGSDPASGMMVTVRVGPYGPYVQLGEKAPDAPKAKKPRKKKAKAGEAVATETADPVVEAPKVKRVSLLKGMDATTLDFDTALKLLSLPRSLGTHPETGEPVQAGVGRFGPYLKHGAKFVTLPADDDVLSIGLNRACIVIAEKAANAGTRFGRAAAPGKAVGNHPSDGKPITLHSGKYGQYLKHGKLNATLPKDVDADTLTIEQAVDILAKRAEKAGGRGGKKPTAPKTTKEKPAKKAKKG